MRRLARHFGFWLMGVRRCQEPTFSWGRSIYEWGNYYTDTKSEEE